MRITLLTILMILTSPIDSPGQTKIERIQWNNSKLIGTPEAPLPFVNQRVFEQVKLQNPTEMIRQPKSDRWVVLQMNGKVVSFSKSANHDVNVAMDLKNGGPCFRAYGIVFHPEFPAQPYCYLAYSAEKKKADGTRLSRFTVTDPVRLSIDRGSEKVLARWSSVDHCGGSLHFGPDRNLYFSVGDGQKPNPPDPQGTGQDISDLQASIHRIDVDQTTGQLPYRIPPDNPFVNVAGARGEVWAFGLRNPWKMAFHPKTGELWTGDVGWEMKEMVYRIDRGANYGWSVLEGTQLIKLNGARHAVPITPPILEYDHTEGRSITGGYFWQSDRIPELKDAYIYGDYVSGKIWGLKHDGKKITWQRELTKTPIQIICFALDDDGAVLTVGFDGSIHRLARNPTEDNQANTKFPKRLSQTGLFHSVVDQTPSPGVIPYSINAHHWADHTTSEQWFGLVGDTQLGIHENNIYDLGQVAGYFNFPRGSVFAKTVSYQTDMSDPNSKRHLETQVLHRLDLDWRAYNYIWNEDQTDAILQDNVAVYQELEIKDPKVVGGVRKQTWLHASRDQCMLCHIWRAGSVNGFRVEQLNRQHKDESINQLEKFEATGLVDVKLNRSKPAVSPTDESASISDRARRYLDLNCAHCHMRGGGGSAPFVLQASLPDDKINLIGTESLQGDFGIDHALTVSPGHPSKSTLLYRMAKSGPGKMPKFGTQLVDEKGVKLIHDWIASMDSHSENEAAKQIKVLISLKDDSEFKDSLKTALSQTETALLLSIWCSGQSANNPRRKTVITAAEATSGPIRDLFEHFFPAEKKTKRLGPKFIASELLSIKGDAKRGHALFLSSSFTCKNCHQINGVGKMVGPDLGDIGSKRKPSELLKSLLDPSAEMEDQFRGVLIVTAEGNIISGLKGSSNATTLEVIDIEGNKNVVQIDDIEELKTLEKSIMPERLLEEFTAQQAADLLAFLQSLKANQ